MCELVVTVLLMSFVVESLQAYFFWKATCVFNYENIYCG